MHIGEVFDELMMESKRKSRFSASLGGMRYDLYDLYIAPDLPMRLKLIITQREHRGTYAEMVLYRGARSHIGGALIEVGKRMSRVGSVRNLSNLAYAYVPSKRWRQFE